MKSLYTLVMMQLRDKLDLSFIRKKKTLLFKIVLFVVLFAVVTVAFSLVFSLCSRFGVFSLLGGVPSTFVTAIFTVIQLMSLVSCTLGLTDTLYISKDNAVLLTMPVGHSKVFLSKLIVYYIFELKRNITFTVPMFIAYGVFSHAVWYFYPWLVVCFFLFSLLPVGLASILSIPTLYVSSFIRRYRWLQLTLTTILTAGVAWLFFFVVGKIPANINFIGQWGSIAEGIRQFLNKFAQIFIPYHYVNLMTIGGELKIATSLLAGDTMLYFAILVGVLVASVGLSFLLARPLFFKMASSQFEFEKKTLAPKKNVIHNKKSSLFAQDLQRNFRDSKFIVNLALELVLPTALLFALNKIYAAMNTSIGGQKMTMAFSVLTIAMTIVSFNTKFASIYSRDGMARNVEKTRPVSFFAITVSRLVTRAAVLMLSAVFACVVYVTVFDLSAKNGILMLIIVTFLGLAHLLWSAELDIMNPQTENFQTFGIDFDNPNERKSLIIAILLAAACAFLLWFFFNEGILNAFLRVFAVVTVFFAARIYLFVTRVKLYYMEK